MRSTPGKGSTFTLCLPVGSLGTGPTPVPVGPSVESLGLGVLAAEDNPVNQLVLAGLLKALGCTVTMVDDGDKAVEAWSDGAFDVVLLDVHMPNMSGTEAVRVLRGLEGAADVPVIAVTASAMPREVDACLEAGMDAVLPKPVTRASIVEALEGLLASRLA